MSKLSNVHDVLTSVISSYGILLSLEDINNVINTVLLVLGVINILIMLFFRILNIVKKKQPLEDTLKDINEVVEDTKESIGDLKK